MSIIQKSHLRDPSPDTPLVIGMTVGEYREARQLIGEGPYNLVQPLVQMLDAQVAAQLEKPSYLQDVPAEKRLEFRCTYGDYLAVLGVIGGIPYVRAAPVMHHLASIVENQLHAANRRQLAN